MRKNTLRVLSSVLCLIFLASLFQAPLMAAAQSIPVRVGDQLFNVTPGQWVSVKTPTGTAHFNVRFVNGRPVALEMNQYTKLVFGDAALGASVADDVAQATGSTSGKTSGQAGQSNQSNQAGQAGQSNQSNQAGQAGQSNQSNQAGQAGQSNQSNQAGQAGQSNQSNQAGQAGQSNQSNQAGQAGQSNQSNQAGQAGQSNQSNQAGQAGQSNQSTQTAAGSLADDVAQASAPKSNWDPSRHPRDPQTGRFISHEEAMQRGLMDAPAGSSVADDVAQAGSPAGQVADDVAQSSGSAAGQVADDVAQSSGSTAGQVADDVAAGTGDAKPTVGDKFQSGYATGKGMTQQGFQNVKDSLKSGFSAKNLLVTAGITVGVDLATQIMRGEKPSAAKALKTVCSAEFVGGVGGAVLGAAGGSFFVPFLSAIPVVGGALSALAPAFGSIVGSSMGAYLAGDMKNGKFSIKEAFKRIDWVGVTGQAIGSTVGAALGSALGPIGTIAGGMVGGYLGNWAAQKIVGMFDKNQTANLPTLAMPTGSATVAGPRVTLGGELVPAPAMSGNTTDDVLVIGGNNAVLGDYESEVALAYSKYQELYKLYNEMIRQGRQEDALSVAEPMNQAKREYDALRTQSGK